MPNLGAGNDRLDRLLGSIRESGPFASYGRTTSVVGLVIQATGLDVSLGELCRVMSFSDSSTVLAEVVGFHEGAVLLLPLGELEGVHPGSAVEPLGRSFGVDVGPGLLGRVLNGLGEPMDDGGDLGPTRRAPLVADPPHPLQRDTIEEPLVTGVRAIDGLLTLGRGQRIGVFAGSGVGKSTLLGMIARNSSADVNVIALLGERGREVRDFIEQSLGEEGLARSVVIVATGDEAALIRARGALVATSIAEHFRDQGKHVLLMVDSITRVAMAWREIGLAAGEPPTTKGYPPSVFASLPRLLERAGNAKRGSITGVYSVLVEGDDFTEPVADATRSILDGHIVLSRDIAAAGHFPAIDILASKSRLSDRITDAEHRRAAASFLRLEALYRDKEDLIAVGAYQAGTAPLVDVAIQLRPRTSSFLQQDPATISDLPSTRQYLSDLAEEVARVEISGAV